MSLKVMTWVFYESRAKGIDKLVLLAIGDHAHDDGASAYPGLELLAKKGGVSEATVSRSIRRLQALGELEVEEGERVGRGAKFSYVILMAQKVAERKDTKAAGPKVAESNPSLGKGYADAPEKVAQTPSPIEVEPSLTEPTPPTAVPADAGPAPADGEVALRNGRAMQAANGTLARLKAEVEAGRRSWSLSEAATAEWLWLLDDDHGLRAAQEFVMFYLGLNTGRADFAPAHWSMCGLRVRRWRGLVLHGVDEAITRVDPDEKDDRGRIGQPFWAYVEKVCQVTHDRNQEGASP